MLPIRVKTAGFALKLSHFRSFSILGNSLRNSAGSGSGAESIAEARHNEAPICALWSCSVNRVSASGLTMEENGGLVMWEDMAEMALMHVDRTAESGSRSRRIRLESIFERKGDRASPWVSERIPRSLTHCLRTGDLSEGSVWWMHDRNGGSRSWVRVRAMDSSSVAAMDWVSRSESLVRQVKTRCFRFWGDDCLGWSIVGASRSVRFQ